MVRSYFRPAGVTMVFTREYFVPAVLSFSATCCAR